MKIQKIKKKTLKDFKATKTDADTGRIHFFLEISKLFQKVMIFFEIKYPVFKKFFKNVLEKPKPF